MADKAGMGCAEGICRQGNLAKGQSRASDIHKDKRQAAFAKGAATVARENK